MTTKVFSFILICLCQWFVPCFFTKWLLIGNKYVDCVMEGWLCFTFFRRLYIFLRKLWKCSCCCHNASCQTIAVQCLRCSEKFLFYLYVVARVFWVVARWLLSSLSQNNSIVSLCDILGTRYCLGRSFNRNLIIFLPISLSSRQKL